MEQKTTSGLYETIKRCLPEGECTLCTVLEGGCRGEKVLFCGQRKVWSTGNSAALEEIQARLPEGKSGLTEGEDGRIFCEKFGDRGRLVICGAGHVSLPVIGMGKRLGFFVTVLEDRPAFAERARTAGADEVICGSFEQGLAGLCGGSETYFVIVTRGHSHDMLCLEQALKKENAYIGMMGSHKRVSMVRKQLEEQGIDAGTLARVHAPIGLPIGAETPEEIAVSILAEIIQVRSQKGRTAGYAGDILKALLDAEEKREPCVLAVIISRKGSAPRKVGTKILVFSDGRTVGTIGGGYMEGEVIKKAEQMLGEAASPQVFRVDMSGNDAGDEGMVCGGVVEVYLERSVWD